MPQTSSPPQTRLLELFLRRVALMVEDRESLEALANSGLLRESLAGAFHFYADLVSELHEVE